MKFKGKDIMAVSHLGKSVGVVRSMGKIIWPNPPMQVPVLSLGSVGVDYINMSWSTIAGATSYDVMVKLPINSSYIKAATVYGTNYMYIANDNSTYSFYVIARNVAGSVNSNSITTTTPARVTQAGTPQNIRITAVSATTISVAWDAVANASQYVLEMNQANTRTIPGANNTSYTYNNLQPSTTYNFRVRAFNELGYGQYSNTVSGTTTAIVPPPEPTVDPPVITSADSHPLTQPNIALSYQITATNNPTSYSAVNLPAGLTVNTSTGVISGSVGVVGEYRVTVRATNGGGTGIKAVKFIIANIGQAGVRYSTVNTDICTTTNDIQVYMNNSTLGNSTIYYSNGAGTTYAPSGYYKYISESVLSVFHWDSATLKVTYIGNCPL